MPEIVGNGANPEHLLQPTSRMVVCPACGAEVNSEVERTTRLLLSTLDEARRSKLAETYGGEPPALLCATCFLPTVAVLNGVGA